MTKLYVYAIAPGNACFSLDTKAVANSAATPRFIACGAISVLVSDIDQDEVLPVRRNMMAHTKTLECAMAQTTILPMQFGIIVDDLAALAAITKQSTHAIKEALLRLEGHAEVGLKITWDETVIFNEIAAQQPELQAKSSALTKRGESETYYDRIDLGRKVDAAIQAKRASEAKRITDLVTPLSVAMKALDLDDDMSVVNLALLIPHGAMDQLEATLDVLDQTEKDRLTIRFVAPVPAYNFVSLRLDFSNPGDREKAA